MKIKFVKQDQWIGHYYKDNITNFDSDSHRILRKRTHYICIIPCIAIIFERRKQWGINPQHHKNCDGEYGVCKSTKCKCECHKD